MVASSTTPTSNAAATTTPQQNGDAAAAVVAPTNHVTTPLPKGKYTLVGIDIDTTGRRLIDEIVQLAAYTPKDHFEQYIMPYMNLNPAARQRHQVRVISIGFYRMLKSMQTYKIIKSKSEIAALKDFLAWLEALKAKDATSQGVILLYHEERKFIPYMILEALKKYNLLDRFLLTVKSFANGLNLAKANANESLQHYTLRKLSKFLKSNAVNNNVELNNNNVASSTTEGAAAAATTTTKDQPQEQSQQQQQHQQKTNNKSSQNNNNERELFDGSASVRAKLAYEVALHLCNQDSKEDLDSQNALDKLLTAINPYAQTIQCDLDELQTQNENLERQNSFRPVFLNYFKSILYNRVRAVKFRIILAEHGYDLQTLNAIWTEKKRDGLVEVLQAIEELKEEDKTELADLFDSYYDPAKTTIKPIVKPINRSRNRRVRNNVRNDGKVAPANSGAPAAEQGAGGDKQQASGANLPDSTTKSPKNRGKRNQRSQKNNNNNNSTNNNNNVLIKTETPVANDTPTAAADGNQKQQQTTNNATTAAPVAVAASN
ncbi:maternal protein exuperantia [Musca autumnalis]|uniref:maternal protein exuperantia n=1 Tax=Musca autumnalis TaxID=221902 RepID=UPI003CF77E70